MSKRIAPIPTPQEHSKKERGQQTVIIFDSAPGSGYLLQPNKNSSKASIGSADPISHRPHNSSSDETLLLMNDPFMDSPASVSGETTMSTNGSTAAATSNGGKKQPSYTNITTSTTTTNQIDGSVDHTQHINTALPRNRTEQSTNNDSERRNCTYTDAVRNMYFEHPQTQTSSSYNNYHHHHNHNHLGEAPKASPANSMNSHMDFSEMFEVYEDVARYEDQSPATRTRQSLGTATSRNSNCPTHTLQDAASAQYDDRSTVRTPPMTICGENTSSPAGTPIELRGAYATESAGIMSPFHSDTMQDTSSGRNTPHSQLQQQQEQKQHANAYDVFESVASSVASTVMRSSPGSINVTSSLLAKQPVLYSAIGSLEQVNNSSLRNLNNRLLAPSKDFCRIGAAHPITLIPPANRQPKSLLLGNTQQQQHQQTVTGISMNSNVVDKPPTTISVIEAKTATKVNGEELFGVLKKKSSICQKEKSDDTTISNDPGKVSNVKKSADGREKNKKDKKVSYDARVKPKRKKKGPIEMFRPSSDAYTPRIERKSIKYRAAEARTPVQQMASPMGTLHRPNFKDALRRVAMIIHQHVVKIESRFEGQSDTKLATDDGLFKASMRDLFNEDSYRTPTYKCNMVRIPMARPGMVYGLRKIRIPYEIPSETEIYEFGHQLFNAVHLSSECSIVCLIYVERLMEIAKVPLLACTWRPIFICGLLLASKVWQDMSTWNIEFASVYPQFSLEAINRLELNFLRNVKWDLYISSSLYAKYYFALRSLVEKQDFRQRYNRMVGGVDTVAQSEALKVQKRTEQVKEEALLQLSRSM